MRSPAYVPVTGTASNADFGGDVTVTGNITTQNSLSVANTAEVGGDAEVVGFLAMGSGQSTGDFSVFGNNAKSLKAGSAGGGLSIAEGANARMGTSTLVAGTVTVANTSVTANTRIFLTTQTIGGVIGVQYISARVVGTSFTITSNNVADTSTVAWLLIEPA